MGRQIDFFFQLVEDPFDALVDPLFEHDVDVERGIKLTQGAQVVIKAGA